MILRKPYAILIKNFRLIHLVLIFLMSYLIVRTSSLLNFFNENITGEGIIQGYDISRELFNSWMFLFTILIVLASFTILSLMYFKKKPVLVYLVNIVTYILLGVLYYVALNNVDILEVRMIDIRVLRAIRDFLIGAMVIQTITTALMFVRATGFDIKKFNFSEDLDELEISEEDREEFELGLEFDYDKFIRVVKRKIRHAKYVYFENKFIINIFVLVFTIGITTYSLINIFILNRAYNENVLFETDYYYIRVNKTYTTQKDYKDNLILEDTKLVIIELDIRNSFDAYLKLDTVLTELVIDNKYFRPTNKYDEQIYDIGTTYNSNVLTKDMQNYLFVYEVPKNLDLEEAYFLYSEILEKTNKIVTKKYKVNINPSNLDEDITIKEVALGETIDFSNTVLKKGSIVIDDVSFSGSFIYIYNLCHSDVCVESSERINPTLTGREDKNLMIVRSTYESTKVSKISEFFLNYVTINLEDQTNQVPLKELTSKRIKLSNLNLFEVDSMFLGQEDIEIQIKIRNKMFIVQ